MKWEFPSSSSTCLVVVESFSGNWRLTACPFPPWQNAKLGKAREWVKKKCWQGLNRPPSINHRYHPRIKWMPHSFSSSIPHTVTSIIPVVLLCSFPLSFSGREIPPLTCRYRHQLYMPLLVKPIIQVDKLNTIPIIPHQGYIPSRELHCSTMHKYFRLTNSPDYPFSPIHCQNNYHRT